MNRPAEPIHKPTKLIHGWLLLLIGSAGSAALLAGFEHHEKWSGPTLGVGEGEDRATHWCSATTPMPALDPPSESGHTSELTGSTSLEAGSVGSVSPNTGSDAQALEAPLQHRCRC